MKNLWKALSILALTLVIVVGGVNVVHAEETIDEFAGEPIIVYGAKLSDAQKEETRNLLNASKEKVHELIVDGTDLNKYIGGNPNANMYSSVKITYKKAGHGIVVNILTGDNITKVTSDMYMNALLTAGVENALVEVASPVKVTGESALTGIYKAYDATNDDLDPERMKIANEELEISTELADRDGITDEQVASLMAEIKKAIAENKPVSREEIEAIVKEQLDNLNIELSEADRQLLIDLFDKMKDLNIDFDKLKDQLDDIASSIKDKLDDLDIQIDRNFFEKVLDFFKDLFDSIANMFGSDKE